MSDAQLYSKFKRSVHITSCKISIMKIDDIIAVQKKHEKNLFQKANVVSVGCGYKFKDGEKTSEICIVVGVAKKMPVALLSAKDTIPQSLDGCPIDVYEAGVIQTHQAVDPTNRFRPAIPGTSIGHKNITAGTFGCVVQRGGAKLILSNNHVLANSNNASIGDEIYQPGPIDGGTSSDQIGTLFDFVKIEFGGSGGEPNPTCPFAKGAASTANLMSAVLGRKHRLVAFNADPFAATNKVDCALALPTEEADITDEIVQIGKPAGIDVASLGMPVQKYGRTTRYTTGEILQINVTVQVSYGPGQIATFTGQLMAGAMSAGGDSGSALLSMDKKVVGLLYAGSNTTTIFNKIQDVFNLLSVTL